MVAAFVYTPARPRLRVLLLALLFRPMAATHTADAALLKKWLVAKVFMVMDYSTCQACAQPVIQAVTGSIQS
jgi:hypothetical protein